VNSVCIVYFVTNAYVMEIMLGCFGSFVCELIELSLTPLIASLNESLM
jgi:hypothetical protein